MRGSVSSALTGLIPLTGIFVLLALAARHPVMLPVLALNWLALLLSMAVSTLVHEAGHVVAARAVGLRVPLLEIGHGRPIWRHALGPMQVVVHAFPMFGMTTLITPTMRRLRARLMAATAGGPLANVLLLWIAVSLIQAGVDDVGDRAAPMLSLALANAWMLFTSLVPRPPAFARRHLTPGNDGWNLLTVPFREEEQLAPMFTLYALIEATRLLAEGKREGADPTFLEEAEHWSKLAHEREPDDPHVRGTRGVVLVARGELGPAEGHLTFAFAGKVGAHAKAIYACCLTILCARTGRSGEAQEWLQKARSMSPDSSLLTRAEDAVASQRDEAAEAEGRPA
jgi:hypothetical protein